VSHLWVCVSVLGKRTDPLSCHRPASRAGKTVQAIALIAALHDEAARRSGGNGASAGPHLIVVPKSTLGNWEREFRTWAPGLCVTTYSGGAEEREAARATEWFVCDEGTGDAMRSPPTSRTFASAAAGSRNGFPHVVFDVLLTSYETVSLDLAEIRQCMLAVEAHGGRHAFLGRRDGLDVHIDGAAGAGLLAFPPEGLASRGQPASAAGGDAASKKRKREAVAAEDAYADLFPHLIPLPGRAHLHGGHPTSAFESWGSIIVDEGHRLRNAGAMLFETLTSKVMRNARHRIVMTGTPIQVRAGNVRAR
jgi:hypothetical protein